MWALVMTLIASFILVLGSWSQRPLDIESQEPQNNEQVMQFVNYAMAVAKYADRHPDSFDVWDMNDLRPYFPLGFLCGEDGRVCPWRNGYDAATRFRFAYGGGVGQPGFDRGFMRTYARLMGETSAYGIKNNGLLSGRKIPTVNGTNAVNLPIWIPEGAAVFLMRQRGS